MECPGGADVAPLRHGLPYVIMRYFLGGIDLRGELTVFYYLFLLSAVLSSLTIAFSVFPSFLVRSALAMVAGSLALQLTGQLLETRALPREWLSSAGLTMATFASGYSCWFVLEFGASRIASAAENHAVRKRLVSLIVVTVVTMVAAFAVPAWHFLSLALALISVVDALVEPNNANRSVLLPFVRCGFIGRLAGRLFYPGWSSGVWFTLLIAGIVVGFDYVQPGNAAGGIVPADRILQWVAWPAAALLPVPILWILERCRHSENRFGFYMIVQLAVCFGVFWCSVSGNGIKTVAGGPDSRHISQRSSGRYFWFAIRRFAWSVAGANPFSCLYIRRLHRRGQCGGCVVWIPKRARRRTGNHSGFPNG